MYYLLMGIFIVSCDKLRIAKKVFLLEISKDMRKNTADL